MRAHCIAPLSVRARSTPEALDRRPSAPYEGLVPERVVAEQSKAKPVVHLAANGACCAGRSVLLALALAASTTACRSGDVQDTPARPVVITAGGAGSKPRGIKASDREPPLASPPWHIPVGPTLAILPGQGLGPIRFGAHLDTIERLIGEPCEEKTEEAGHTLCRYSAQAVEFVLTNGEVTEIRAHRLGRPFKPGTKADYGIFNGRFESGAAFGMVPGGVQELLGKPKASRTVEGENPNHTVEIYEYDGATLEFDRISPQSVVLGGVILKAPKKS